MPAPMAADRDDEGGRGKPPAGQGPGKGTADGRRARLEQALRANLLKRKAKSRARKAPPAPPEEGGQSQG
jgi:hypothetical protein